MRAMTTPKAPRVQVVMHDGRVVAATCRYVGRPYGYDAWRVLAPGDRVIGIASVTSLPPRAMILMPLNNDVDEVNP